LRNQTSTRAQASHTGLLDGAATSAAVQGWVGFEGIAASGKTTQTRLLAEHLRSSNPDVVPEFGHHELGRYLSEFGSPNMRLTPEGCDTSYVRHLLALASHVQKLDEARRGTRRKLVLLDVATLTDAAYALADLPPELGPDLRPRLMAAVGSLIERVHPPADNGILLYLDCDPKVAADRLDERTGIRDESRYDVLVRMHDAYRDLLADRPDVRRINANREPQDVAADVRAEVGRLFR
jgi:thymidylate kinase